MLISSRRTCDVIGRMKHIVSKLEIVGGKVSGEVEKKGVKCCCLSHSYVYLPAKQYTLTRARHGDLIELFE